MYKLSPHIRLVACIPYMVTMCDNVIETTLVVEQFTCIQAVKHLLSVMYRFYTSPGYTRYIWRPKEGFKQPPLNPMDLQRVLSSPLKVHVHLPIYAIVHAVISQETLKKHLWRGGRQQMKAGTWQETESLHTYIHTYIQHTAYIHTYIHTYIVYIHTSTINLGYYWMWGFKRNSQNEPLKFIAHGYVFKWLQFSHIAGISKGLYRCRLCVKDSSQLGYTLLW